MVIKNRIVEAWYMEVFGMDITKRNYPEPSHEVKETVKQISNLSKETILKSKQ